MELNKKNDEKKGGLQMTEITIRENGANVEVVTNADWFQTLLTLMNGILHFHYESTDEERREMERFVEEVNLSEMLRDQRKTCDELKKNKEEGSK